MRQEIEQLAQQYLEDPRNDEEQLDYESALELAGAMMPEAQRVCAVWDMYSEAGKQIEYGIWLGGVADHLTATLQR